MKQVNALKYLSIYFEYTNIVASKARKMLGAISNKLCQWHMHKHIRSLYMVYLTSTVQQIYYYIWEDHGW